jgi:hypothetical protein
MPTLSPLSPLPRTLVAPQAVLLLVPAPCRRNSRGPPPATAAAGSPSLSPASAAPLPPLAAPLPLPSPPFSGCRPAGLPLSSPVAYYSPDDQRGSSHLPPTARPGLRSSARIVSDRLFSSRVMLSSPPVRRRGKPWRRSNRAVA